METMDAPFPRAFEKKGHACILVERVLEPQRRIKIGVHRGFNVRGGNTSHGGGKPGLGRRTADGPVQLGGAKAVKEGVPPVKLNHAHGAGVGVGKDGFTAEFGNDLLVAG
jgi:hypothetical protein